jgi:hypothetical protein
VSALERSILFRQALKALFKSMTPRSLQIGALDPDELKPVEFSICNGNHIAKNKAEGQLIIMNTSINISFPSRVPRTQCILSGFRLSARKVCTRHTPTEHVGNVNLNLSSAVGME